LGAVTQSKRGTERRICPFTGAVECNPDVEEKDSNPDSFLYHHMPLSPDAPLSESMNSDGTDERACAKDTDESLDSDLTQMLSDPSNPPADPSMNTSGSGQPCAQPATLGTPPPLYLQARSYNRMYISCTSLKNVHEIYLKTAFDVHWYIHLTYNEKNQNVQYDLHCY